jgi:hypothetical protein
VTSRAAASAGCSSPSIPPPGTIQNEEASLLGPTTRRRSILSSLSRTMTQAEGRFRGCHASHRRGVSQGSQTLMSPELRSRMDVESGPCRRYDAVGELYEADSPNVYDDPAIERTMELAGNVQGLATLDLTCGHGRMSRELAGRGPGAACDRVPLRRCI